MRKFVYSEENPKRGMTTEEILQDEEIEPLILFEFLKKFGFYNRKLI